MLWLAIMAASVAALGLILNAALSLIQRRDPTASLLRVVMAFIAVLLVDILIKAWRLWGG